MIDLSFNVMKEHHNIVNVIKVVQDAIANKLFFSIQG